MSAAPHISDDPQAIILQAQLKRLKAEKDEAAEPEPDHKQPDPAAESNQDATPPDTEGTAPITQHLPPLYELIEQGKVLALNMPAGINPALARAVGVMLKTLGYKRFSCARPR